MSQLDSRQLEKIVLRRAAERVILVQKLHEILSRPDDDPTRQRVVELLNRAAERRGADAG